MIILFRLRLRKSSGTAGRRRRPVANRYTQWPQSLPKPMQPTPVFSLSPYRPLGLKAVPQIYPHLVFAGVANNPTRVFASIAFIKLSDVDASIPRPTTLKCTGQGALI